MKRTVIIFAAAALPAGLSLSCTDPGASAPATTDVPLRYAYPRAATADTLYRPISIGTLTFDVNAAADTAAAPGHGIDLRYPLYGGSFFMSVNDEKTADGLAAAIANRRQRFALNLAGIPARSERFVNDAGFVCELVSTAEPVVTPVLFIAHDGQHTLLSGAFAFDDLRPAATADSLAPTADALRADALRLLRSIRKK